MGPVLGGILAAGLYEYLYCPDPVMKKRLKQVFQKAPSGKYREVEADDISKAIHSTELEKKDPTGEVLSSV